MTVAKLFEGINLIKTGMMVFENTESEEKTLATTRKYFENSF